MKYYKQSNIAAILTVSSVDVVLRVIQTESHRLQQALHGHRQEGGSAVEGFGLQKGQEAVGESRTATEDEHLLLLTLKTAQHLVKPLSRQATQCGALGTVSVKKQKSNQKAGGAMLRSNSHRSWRIRGRLSLKSQHETNLSKVVAMDWSATCASLMAPMCFRRPNASRITPPASTTSLSHSSS